MPNDFVHGLGTFRLFAFISLFGDARKKVSLIHNGESLLSRTIALASMVQQIERVAVVSDREYDLKASIGQDKIDFIMIPPNDQWDLNSPCIPISCMREILSSPSIKLHSISHSHGIIFINPLFPWYTPHPFQEAIEIFVSQFGQPRPWRSVVSVNVLQNQYHPKKVLKIDEKGELKHFQPEGLKIYQRQQLLGDEYYEINDALAVIDPKLKGDLLSDEGGLFGYVTDRSITRINSRQDLKIVEALNRN